MTREEIAIAKRSLGRMFYFERSEVLGRFDFIPEEIKRQALDALSGKEAELKQDNPRILDLEKKMTVWAEDNLDFLDEFLITIEFRIFREASMRATGPA